jgi:hypothetical protein
MTISKIRPDDDTTLGMLMGAVQRLTDQQMTTSSKVDKLSEKLDRVARQNRDFYHSELEPIKERLRVVEGDMEEITGVHDSRELERAARTHRARAEAEHIQRRRLQRWGALAAPVVAGFGAALWQLIQAALK